MRISDSVLRRITFWLLRSSEIIAIPEITDPRYQEDPDPLFERWMALSLASFRPEGRKRSSGGLSFDQKIERLLWGTSRDTLHTRSLRTSQLHGVANISIGDEIGFGRRPGIDIVYFDQIEPHLLETHPDKPHLDAQGLWDDAIKDNPKWKGVVVADTQLNGAAIIQGSDGAHRLTLARKRFIRDHHDKPQDVTFKGRWPTRLFSRVLRERQMVLVRIRAKDSIKSILLDRIAARRNGDFRLKMVEAGEHQMFAMIWKKDEAGSLLLQGLGSNIVDVAELIALRTSP